MEPIILSGRFVFRLLLYLLRKYLFVTYVYYSVVEARGQFFANLKKVSNRAVTGQVRRKTKKVRRVEGGQYKQRTVISLSCLS